MIPPDPRIMADDAKSERIHWLAWLAMGLGVAALVGLAIVPGVRMKIRDAAFREIEEKDTEERVFRLMGPSFPGYVAPPPDLHRYWGDEVNPAVRAEDIDYVLTWEIWFPTGTVTWQVGFDNESRAVAKHRYD